jgi:hypothetical protein
MKLSVVELKCHNYVTVLIITCTVYKVNCRFIIEIISQRSIYIAWLHIECILHCSVHTRNIFLLIFMAAYKGGK